MAAVNKTTGPKVGPGPFHLRVPSTGLGGTHQFARGIPIHRVSARIAFVRGDARGMEPPRGTKVPCGRYLSRLSHQGC
jgi:hypothetical protein